MRAIFFDEMKEGIDFAHKHGKKVYLTANIFARNEDIKKIDEFFDIIKSFEFDGIIVSDPGIFVKAKKLGIPIHISTQANTTNYESARFWHQLGAKRIVLARELSLDEIREIRENVPDILELEAFVHGAVCISYSGRCFLSAYMTYRDANRGECAHPCRYKYYVMEEKDQASILRYLKMLMARIFLTRKTFAWLSTLTSLLLQVLTLLRLKEG
nr:peptidase U32 family protein [Caldicellulosiruptor bescii]